METRPETVRARTMRVSVHAVLLFLIWAAVFQACGGLPGKGPASPVTIAAVGDTHGHNIRYGDDGPLGTVRNLLDEQDIFLFNLEGAILSEGAPSVTCRPSPNQSLFWSSSSIADFLDPTSQAVAVLANNHILDCGAFGIQETLRELASRGIRTVGAGESAEAAYQPLTLETSGMRVAVVSYLAMDPNPFSAGPGRAGVASWEDSSTDSRIAQAAASADVVVVVLHLHLRRAWTDETPPEHLALAERALDAGADIVVAHGPHVLNGVLVRHGGVALLSLGNFLFRPDYVMPPQAHDAVLAKVTVWPDRLEIRLLPIMLDGRGRPFDPAPEDAERILTHLADLSAELGTDLEIVEGVGRITVDR